MTQIYNYPPLFEGKLISRYKRFFADIELTTGELITAHCPNTGPMTGICLLGNRVMVSKSDSKTRKLAYTWELIEVNDNDRPVWCGVNTALPNKVVKAAIEQKVIAELSDYVSIRSEVPYGQEKSRIDLVLDTTDRPVYIEVKNTTWTNGTLALFPDTVTQRGQKHIRELVTIIPEARAVMLYFINRGDCDRFSPGDDRDPKYGQLLREAVKSGLQVLPCRFDITPQGITYLGLAELILL
ncbi:MAG: DNA/RNA nuclease SfsA [Cyanobacteria bacterium]|nr:DNA/RNA nuclease SfsA [Cyanobacteriota bacterium]